MINIDELVWPKSSSIKEYSSEQWINIVKYVLKKLQTFLNQPIDHEQLEDNIGDGFCINISSPKPLLGAFALSWKGILGGQVLDEGQRLDISATLFLYSNKKKLLTKSGASFLELVYEKDNLGKGNWRLYGWLEDVHYEYEFFDQDNERA